MLPYPDLGGGERAPKGDSQFATYGVKVESGRIQKPLDGETAQDSDDHRGLGGGIGIAADIAVVDSPLDESSDGGAKLPVGICHVAPDRGQGAERLANQDEEGVSVSCRGGAQVTFGEDKEGGQSAAILELSHRVARKAFLDLAGDGANEGILGAEAMADEAVAVAGEFADLSERGAAAALAFDELDGGGKHAPIRGFPAFALGTAA